MYDIATWRLEFIEYWIEWDQFNTKELQLLQKKLNKILKRINDLLDKSSLSGDKHLAQSIKKNKGG